MALTRGTGRNDVEGRGKGAGFEAGAILVLPNIDLRMPFRGEICNSTV